MQSFICKAEVAHGSAGSEANAGTETEARYRRTAQTQPLDVL